MSKYQGKHLTLSRRRLSKKKGWKLRRRILKMQKNISTDNQNTESNDKSIKFGESLQSLSNVNANLNTGVLQNVNVKEETVEIQNEDTYEGNVEHCIKEEAIDIKDEYMYDKNVEHCIKEELLEIRNKDIEHCVDNNFVKKNLSDTHCIKKNMPEGRRIVNINYMWNEIQRSYNDHIRGVECPFRDWALVNSRRRGLLTQLFFKCNCCNYETNIWSEPNTWPVNSETDVNTAAAAGTVTIGIGYCQLQKLFASMNIPCMSDKTYIKYRDNVNEKTAMENMEMTDEAEKKLDQENKETMVLGL